LILKLFRISLHKSLRNAFDVPNSPVNALHGSANPQEAEKELNFFFPMEQTVALIKPGLSEEKRSN
jgi:hypothetical protein